MIKEQKLLDKITELQIEFIKIATKVEINKNRIGPFGNNVLTAQNKSLEAQIRNIKKSIDFNRRKLSNLVSYQSPYLKGEIACESLSK